MKKRMLLIMMSLLALTLFALPIHAQEPEPDPYEPDEVNPPWIANGEVQTRSFYPEGDVDYARFRVKAGHWYNVHTQNLAPLVDTVLTVKMGDVVYQDDDGGAEPLASRIIFQAPETGNAILSILTSQAVYSTTQTYELYAGETAAPTPTPTNTPTPTYTPLPTYTPTLTPTPTWTPTAIPTSTPTSTPQPTFTPAPTSEPPPTATPAKPIVSFSATPDRVQQPGECVTLRWAVERATEVYLVHPSGSQEGVIGQDERQVCPLETGIYSLKVHAPGGDETVEVEVTVPLPTSTPTPKPTGSAGGGGGNAKAGKGTVHAVVFVDENRSEAYDPQEGVLGAAVTLMSQADPGQVWSAATDVAGQAHFAQVPQSSYTLLIPHLGHAETVTVRGEDVTVDVLVAPIQLPVRIP
jgi:hypothetical protein